LTIPLLQAFKFCPEFKSYSNILGIYSLFIVIIY
jgi:hypothetical protein